MLESGGGKRPLTRCLNSDQTLLRQLSVGDRPVISFSLGIRSPGAHQRTCLFRRLCHPCRGSVYVARIGLRRIGHSLPRPACPQPPKQAALFAGEHFILRIGIVNPDRDSAADKVSGSSFDVNVESRDGLVENLPAHFLDRRERTTQRGQRVSRHEVPCRHPAFPLDVERVIPGGRHRCAARNADVIHGRGRTAHAVEHTVRADRRIRFRSGKNEPVPRKSFDGQRPFRSLNQRAGDEAHWRLAAPGNLLFGCPGPCGGLIVGFSRSPGPGRVRIQIQIDFTPDFRVVVSRGRSVRRFRIARFDVR